MADFTSASNLKALSNLLNPVEDDSSDDDMPESGPASFTPGSIGSKKTKIDTSKDSVYAKKKETKDIWDEEEVPEYSVFQDDGDGRPQPEYEITYKQKVSSEDMFLGTTGKNPSTACCEEMIVKIIMPDTKIQDVDLQVKERYLDCRSPKYKLLLPLPHPVDERSGSAKWDSAKHTLAITLTMVREYDFINFQ